MAVALLAFALLLPASPAAAHVHLDLDEADAGAVVDMTFVVPHGCGDLSTTAVHVRLPEGVAVESVRGPAGFDGSVGDGEVSFTGGELVSGGLGAFGVTARMPDVDGRIHFPALQECGAESIRWMDVPGDGRADGQPAPSLVVRGGSRPVGVEATAGAAGTDDEGELTRGAPWGLVTGASGALLGAAAAVVVLRRRRPPAG